MDDSDAQGRSQGSSPAPAPVRLFRSTVALLPHNQRHSLGGSSRRLNWIRFPLLFGRTTARRLLSSSPRDAASLQPQDLPYTWGYSKPVVALDVAWNSAFVLVSAAVLLCTLRERPSTPIRAWLLGYALQCLLHVGFVCFEYRRRRRIRERTRSEWVSVREQEDQESDEEESRAVKKLESLNAMISLLWWMLGFYWIVIGGHTLIQDAPRLYWLTVVFLAFDVFFAIFCVLLTCVIGIALCCCLPCIVAFLHAVAGREGASDTDLGSLPRLRFCLANQPDKLDSENEHEIPITIQEHDSVIDLSLPPEDSECCICLNMYEDGAELHALPCNHHFHSDCIVKWLRINATCPLCKYNIIEDDALV